MPLLASDFRSPWWLPGGHLQTIVPSVARRLLLTSTAVEIWLDDGDRLMADYYAQPAGDDKRLMILTHGLEGSSQQPYVLGMAKTAVAAGFDVLAWNLRGCGAVDNLTAKLYHSGSSQDLDAVVRWAETRGYSGIYLAGYSLGGNITLKWTGEQGAAAAIRGVRSVCTASVPVDLANCVDTLDQPVNWIYRQRFLGDMKRRLTAKAKKFPGSIDLAPMNRIHTMRGYDNTYVGPLNGFADAAAYHAACSSRAYLENIQVPTLLVNALNDPFFGEPCMPRALAESHAHFTLEIAATGGHVGFFSHSNNWWLEQHYLDFFAAHD